MIEVHQAWAGIEVRNIYVTSYRSAQCGKLNWGYSLSSVVKGTGVSLDKEERNKFVGLQGQPFTRQITYETIDVVYLIRIWEQTLLDEAELHQVAELENKAVVVFSEIEYEV